MTFKQAYEKLLRKKTFLFLKYSFIYDRNYKFDFPYIKATNGTLLTLLKEWIEEVDLWDYQKAHNMETDSCDLIAYEMSIYGQIYYTVVRYLRRYYNINTHQITKLINGDFEIVLTKDKILEPLT